MQITKVLSVMTLAGLAILALAATASAADPTAEPEPATEDRTGTIEQTTGPDGTVEYTLGGTRLSVGPPWFWDSSPLAPFVGTSVTVTGAADDGTPSASAPDAAKADGVPSFDVFSIDGTVIREPGKPPWAGGPAVVGERHPGFGHGAEAAPATP